MRRTRAVRKLVAWLQKTGEGKSKVEREVQHRGGDAVEKVEGAIRAAKGQGEFCQVSLAMWETVPFARGLRVVRAAGTTCKANRPIVAALTTWHSEDTARNASELPFPGVDGRLPPEIIQVGV